MGKKAPKLDTDLTCPFCNHPGIVQCNIFFKERRIFVVASCSVDKETYATKQGPIYTRATRTFYRSPDCIARGSRKDSDM
ncbi:hypothetical protein ZEAMMB73_Zm00001d036264 [Zea mays]|uniref:Transcription elongation factor 1 homolog n=1 Tax=Zea mays TaxID=4577 RepID=A0A1D6LLE8_MAIZE|nr:hypothetical protein ZEAMMB73_Zm00001d036264 [Zea mays]